MEAKQERVILVGVETEETWRNFGESMLELKGLTKTAKGTVCFSLIPSSGSANRDWQRKTSRITPVGRSPRGGLGDF